MSLKDDAAYAFYWSRVLVQQKRNRFFELKLSTTAILGSINYFTVYTKCDVNYYYRQIADFLREYYPEKERRKLYE